MSGIGTSNLGLDPKWDRGGNDGGSLVGLQHAYGNLSKVWTTSGTDGGSLVGLQPWETFFSRLQSVRGNDGGSVGGIGTRATLCRFTSVRSGGNAGGSVSGIGIWRFPPDRALPEDHPSAIKSQSATNQPVESDKSKKRVGNSPAVAFP